MELMELKKNWNAYGKTDPLWAILTEVSKRFCRWDEGEFFETGVKQIAAVMEKIQSLGIELKRGKALDFGCGVGRLTQALCDHFEECSGVDIAASMIELALGYNRHGDRCRYFLNERDDLHLFGDNSFDFIYSYVVLQHMRPDYALSYLREFVRILAPGGVIAFQLPCYRISVAMPASGFQAQIVPVEFSTRMEAGVPSWVRARVRNLSDLTWMATGDSDNRCQVRLGDHWLDAQDTMIVRDDARADLPDHLKPGEDVELSIEVHPPEQPGRYTLELDMLQEGVSWFKDKGSRSARISVNVVPASGSRAAARQNGAHSNGSTGSESEPLVMQMYGIEESTVREHLERCGASIVAVELTPGGDWMHGTYYARK
jgi:SAM-dependent methyltransferase